MTSQNEETRNTKPVALPSLEQQPDVIPEMATADFGLPEVHYVIDVMNRCVAAKFAQGGDTKYIVQSAFATAREALGVLVAAGLLECRTTVRINGQDEPLWKNPAVPPMGAPSVRNVTLQG